MCPFFCFCCCTISPPVISIPQRVLPSPCPTHEFIYMHHKNLASPHSPRPPATTHPSSSGESNLAVASKQANSSRQSRTHRYFHFWLTFSASRKRPRSPTAEGAEAPKRTRAGEYGCLTPILSYSPKHLCVDLRRWNVNGPIFGPMTSQCYFLDPAEQEQNSLIVDYAMRGKFILLTGSRASGKSTRLFRLSELLQENGYYCL